MPFLTLFWLGGFPYKRQSRKKLVPTYSILSTGGPRRGQLLKSKPSEGSVARSSATSLARSPRRCWAPSEGSQRPDQRADGEAEVGSLRYGCGSKPIPFWGRCTTHFRTYFGGDWDVHWGYDLDFDPWPYGAMIKVYNSLPSSLEPEDPETS